MLSPARGIITGREPANIVSFCVCQRPYFRIPLHVAVSFASITFVDCESARPPFLSFLFLFSPLSHFPLEPKMSAILSADDLNDFISPGVACIKPIETIPANSEDPSVSTPHGDILEGNVVLTAMTVEPLRSHNRG